MKPQPKCACAMPLAREQVERKGVSQIYCGRCKRPLGLRLAALRPAA